MKGTGRRSRAVAARLLVVLVAGAATGCASTPAESPGPAPEPAATGPLAPTFTVEQATRGQRVFTGICSTCHGRNEFSGPIFAVTWRAEPLAAIYEHISTNMPQDRPGSLTPDQYVDVLAFILQLNGIQPGTQELLPNVALLARMDW